LLKTKNRYRSTLRTVGDIWQQDTSFTETDEGLLSAGRGHYVEDAGGPLGSGRRRLKT
jgi:hypothetical protein